MTNKVLCHASQFIQKKYQIQKKSAKTYGNCGLLNKGNTCYINASLQCLSTIEQLWSNFTCCNNFLSPFTSSFVRIMLLLRSSKSPLDPSQFLQFLQGAVTNQGNLTYLLFNSKMKLRFYLVFLKNFVLNLYMYNIC